MITNNMTTLEITQTKESQSSMSAMDAKQMLVEGNRRFVNRQKTDRDFITQVEMTATGQLHE